MVDNSEAAAFVIGNVWEWVEDCWHVNYSAMPDQTKHFGAAWASEDCIFRVIRGGSWINVAGRLRTANRSRLGAVNRDFNFGFRVARSLPSKSTILPP